MAFNEGQALSAMFTNGLAQIQTSRSENLFQELDRRSLTPAEEEIVAQRVALQRKMLEEYEKRDRKRKVQEVMEICVDLTVEEAEAALKQFGWREEDTAAALTSDSNFRRKLRSMCGLAGAQQAQHAQQTVLVCASASGSNPQGAVVRPRKAVIPQPSKHQTSGAVFVGTFKGKGWERYAAKPKDSGSEDENAARRGNILPALRAVPDPAAQAISEPPPKAGKKGRRSMRRSGGTRGPAPGPSEAAVVGNGAPGAGRAAGGSGGGAAEPEDKAGGAADGSGSGTAEPEAGAGSGGGRAGGGVNSDSSGRAARRSRPGSKGAARPASAGEDAAMDNTAAVAAVDSGEGTFAEGAQPGSCPVQEPKASAASDEQGADPIPDDANAAVEPENELCSNPEDDQRLPAVDAMEPSDAGCAQPAAHQGNIVRAAAGAVVAAASEQEADVSEDDGGAELDEHTDDSDYDGGAVGTSARASRASGRANRAQRASRAAQTDTDSSEDEEQYQLQRASARPQRATRGRLLREADSSEDERPKPKPTVRPQRATRGKPIREADSSEDEQHEVHVTAWPQHASCRPASKADSGDDKQPEAETARPQLANHGNPTQETVLSDGEQVAAQKLVQATARPQRANRGKPAQEADLSEDDELALALQLSAQEASAAKRAGRRTKAQHAADQENEDYAPLAKRQRRRSSEAQASPGKHSSPAGGTQPCSRTGAASSHVPHANVVSPRRKSVAAATHSPRRKSAAGPSPAAKGITDATAAAPAAGSPRQKRRAATSPAAAAAAPRRSPRRTAGTAAASAAEPAAATARSPRRTLAVPVHKPRLGRVKRCSSKQVDLVMLGTLRSEPGWHNKGYIFPEGYVARTVFRSSEVLDQLCVHECQILGPQGSFWPAATFRIIAMDNPDAPLDAKSATGAWNAVLNRINDVIETRRRGGEDLPPPPRTAIAGPEYFGLSHPVIVAQIEALDPNHQCIEYWAGKEDRLAYGLVHGIETVPKEPRAERPPAASRPPRPERGASGLPSRRGRKRQADEDTMYADDFNGEEDEQYVANRWSGVDRRERYRRRCGADDSDAGRADDDNPLPDHIDPITLEPVVTPAISPYGHVMGLATWNAVLAEQGKCPFTQNPLRREQITVLTKNNIERYRDRIN